MLQLLIVRLLLWLANPAEKVVANYVAALNIANLPRLVPFVLTGVALASISWALVHDDRARAVWKTN
jgi:hypothetical protein